MSYSIVAKYRYKILRGDLKVRCRELLIQVCESQELEILKGLVSSDHNHMHIEYAPKLNVSDIVKGLKGRSSRRLQQEFPELKKRYWGNHFWARGSKVSMPIFGTSSGTSSGIQAYQKLANSNPEPGQNLVPSYKHKTKENFNKLAKPRNELEVLISFKENNWPEINGRKFYAYCHARNWKLERGLNILNWKERAKKFIEKGNELKQGATTPISDYLKNLSSIKDRDYDEPL